MRDRTNRQDANDESLLTADGLSIRYGREQILQPHSEYNEMRDQLFRCMALEEFTDTTNPNHEICKHLLENRDNILIVYGGNNGGVSEYIIETQEDHTELFSTITQSIEINGFTSVIIDRHTEGLHIRFLNQLQKLSEYITLNHPGIPVYCVNSSYNSPKLNSLIDNVTFVGMAGFMLGIGVEEYKLEDTRNPTQGYAPDIRSKTFLNLNRLAKPARVYAFAKFAEKDLLKHSHTSMIFHDEFCNDYIRRLNKNNRYILRDEYNDHFREVISDSFASAISKPRALEIASIIEQQVNTHVIEPGLDREIWQVDMPDVGETNPALIEIEENDLFKLAWFSFVNETNTNIYFQYPELENDVFLSEKTTKCLVHRHPFVLFGNHGSLRVLRDMGFETFHTVFDESYDDITDPIDRLDACIAEVERLCKYSNAQWQELWPELKRITDRNFDIIMDKTYTLFNFDKPWELV